MRKFQHGASYSTFLLGVIVASMILKIVVAIWPAYWDDHIINKQIESTLLENDSNLTPSKFISNMNDRLSMNNINDVMRYYEEYLKHVAEYGDTFSIQKKDLPELKMKLGGPNGNWIYLKKCILLNYFY